MPKLSSGLGVPRRVLLGLRRESRTHLWQLRALTLRLRCRRLRRMWRRATEHRVDATKDRDHRLTNEDASAIAALNQTLRAQITRMDAAFAKVEVLSDTIGELGKTIHELNETLKPKEES